MQRNELNSATEKVGNCFFNTNRDNSMDQSDPFESSLSSMVSSPATSNPETVLPGSGDNVIIRELIGRLGNICSSSDISSQSLIKSKNNSNKAKTPLNSIPKLNLPLMDSQIIGNLNLPFSSDPGFAERTARFSSFGGLNCSIGLNGNEFPQILLPVMDSSIKLSRASSNQIMNVTGSQVKFPEMNNKNSPKEKDSRSSSPDSKEESLVSEKIPGEDSIRKAQNDANGRRRKSIPRGKAKETPYMEAANAKIVAENDESTAKRSKQDEADEHNGNGETANDGNRKQNKENSKPAEAPKDNIHDRARRGQATDSHSLAERVRRKKISERMKFLQDLVPACNKVTGKAVMLDEIINYVQSLQRQVEFLSMKLAIVNPRMDMNMEALLSKDMFPSRGSLPHTLCSIDSSAPAFGFEYQHQQGLPMHNDVSGNAETQLSVNLLNSALQKTQGPVDSLTDANPQVGSFWVDDDIHSIVQMGFGQNQPHSYQAVGYR